MSIKADEEIEIKRELLLDIREALINAVYSEDGLDGYEGPELISVVNELLGFDKRFLDIPAPPPAKTDKTYEWRRDDN